MMSVDCQHCDELQRIAIAASKAYHEGLEDLEAAYIRHNSEMVVVLSTRLESALQGRNAAIAELANHENTCSAKKPAEARPFSKHQNA